MSRVPLALSEREGTIPRRRRFQPLPTIAFTLALMLGISVGVQWYAREVSAPRYCADRHGTLALLERIVTEPRPAGDEARRPYLVAAKLLFLVPRQSDETVRAYLYRVGAYIDHHCR